MLTTDRAIFAVRAATLLVLVGAACGRTGLDAPVDVTISGTGGSTGAGGSTGSKPRTVFVTSQTFIGGALGGLDKADLACQQLATTAKLPGTYRAWLGDVTGDPLSRFSKDHGGPYQLVDGTVIAANWDELGSGQLRHAIDLTELGGTPPVSNFCDYNRPQQSLVWTNVTPAGKVADPAWSCGNWSDRKGHSYEAGSTGATDHTWTNFCAGLATQIETCDLFQAALYCFQQ